MTLLELLSWPYARKHLVRSLLTLFGIMLGVAVFTGMHVANQSVLKEFSRTVDRLAGATQLQVSAGEAGFPEEALERVQSSRLVRIAAPVIETVVDAAFVGQGNLLVLAVDMTGDQGLRDYQFEAGKDAEAIPDPLVFLAQPDSLLVTRAFAERNRLTYNSKLELNTMAGRKQFTVRGIMAGDGLASGYGGNIAVMDIYAAQLVFGRGRRFDRIDVALQKDVSLAQGKAELSALLGNGFTVEEPSARGRNFESILKVFAVTFDLSSGFALLIGVFLIYNSFSIAVTQRRKEIGILRCLGATRRQIRTLFLLEGLVGGLLGSALGLVAGLGFAQGIANFTSQLLASAYGLPATPGEARLSWEMVLVSLSVGTATSLLGAFLPARDAAQVDPVKALQKGSGSGIVRTMSRLRLWIALGIAAYAVATLAAPDNAVLFYSGYFSLAVAAILLAPAAVGLLTKVLRPLLARLYPVEGPLAADALLENPRRTAATVTALMLSLCLVVSLAGMTQASYHSLTEWMTQTLNPDLFVTTSESLTSKGFYFPMSMRQELEKLPGVAKVQPVRNFRFRLLDAPAMAIAVDIASLAGTTRGRHVQEGDYDEMHARAATGEAVIISENLASLRRLHKGDTVELPTPSGPLRLPIAGVIRDFSDQQGSVVFDYKVYAKYWKDDSVDIFRIYTAPAQSPAAVRELVLQRFASEKRIFVLLNQDLRKFILQIADQWFGLTYIQTFVAVIIAILGIVNTLTVSIADRQRELGVLRAVGAFRRQVRRAIWLEAITIALCGLVLGIAFGLSNQVFQLKMIRNDISGIGLDFEVAWKVVGVLVVLIPVASLLAALLPAQAALRTPLTEALEYE